ncbi:MAG: hypothetical protein RDV48_08540 [Candidatus Eremiobacteraeota bacterium]|nr:hypothetical protein [Candidatus Eremiobacteraeota bacterium]
MAKEKSAGLAGTLGLLTCYGIAMAYVEAMVVVYLRRLLPLSQWNVEVTDLHSLTMFLSRHHVLWTEQTREAATIIMILAVALLAGGTLRMKAGAFLYTFAIWDLFYYIFLYALIKWPPTLATGDVLFLIPRPWVSPVYVPVIISLAMLMLSLFVMGGKQNGGGKAKKASKGKA